MSRFTNTSDYTNNASTFNSDVSYDRESVDASSYTEDQTSISLSRKSVSENDFTAGSFSNHPDDLANDDSYASGYESRTYDTRTYDTYAYDDSSIPQSPLSDELSSTFASFYLENETFRKVRSTISFLSKPLIFFFLAVPGTGGIGAICRVVHAVTVGAVQRRSVMTPKSLHNPYDLPDGYMRTPAWMQDARLAVPPFVEDIIKTMLNRTGIPALADLQRERWAKAIKDLRRVGEEVVSHTAQETTSPMVPLVLFLPLLSVIAVSVARHAVARRQALADAEGEEDENDSVLQREDELDIFGSTETEEVPFLRAVDTSQNLIENTAAALAAIKAYDQRPNGKDVNFIDRKNTDYHDGMGAGPLPRPAALSPSESPTNPHTVPTSRDLSPVPSVNEDGVAHREPSGVKETTVATTSAQAPVRIPVRPIPMVHTAPYALKGDVVAAVVGEPTAREVNVLLVAAARYNCRRVVLPNSVPALLPVSVPPSLSLERVENVMEYVMSVEEPRGLTTIGVFHRPVTDDTVELSLFTHPSSAVYIFVPARDTGKMVISHMVERCIYSSASLDEPIPANACFYDRSVKERGSGYPTDNNGSL